jgi:hypothetical protein
MARRSVSWLLGTASSNLEVKAGCGWYMYSSTLGRCLGRTKNDRLVEVRSNCHYSALNRSHTLANSKFAWLGADYFGLQ